MRPLLVDLVARFATLEGVLNDLDASVGDGDHGTTILRGLRAANAAPDGAADAFRRAAGGASGTLFSHVLTALLDLDRGGDVGVSLGRAADRVSRLGQAGPGDKTMLDALLPAAGCTDLADAARAAREGAEASRDLAARRGRARHVEGAGVGHIDPGARSVAEMLTVLSERGAWA